MARTTRYGVFAVHKGPDGKLTVRPPTAFQSAEHAIAAAKMFALVLGGAVAFSQAIDEDTGATEDGVIIARLGVMADTQEAAA
jgi:hypothetical protein